mmetsp:Transcript_19393/g.44114  ORF Transcript_19393/g.44114 Transcript_19393/m.44114 type:complete len:268 (+) Transcript_19393:92-895(+)
MTSQTSFESMPGPSSDQATAKALWTTGAKAGSSFPKSSDARSEICEAATKRSGTESLSSAPSACSRSTSSIMPMQAPPMPWSRTYSAELDCTSDGDLGVGVDCIKEFVPGKCCAPACIPDIKAVTPSSMVALVFTSKLPGSFSRAACNSPASALQMWLIWSTTVSPRPRIADRQAPSKMSQMYSQQEARPSSASGSACEQAHAASLLVHSTRHCKGSVRQLAHSYGQAPGPPLLKLERNWSKRDVTQCFTSLLMIHRSPLSSASATA